MIFNKNVDILKVKYHYFFMISVLSYLFFDKYWHFFKKCWYFREMSTFFSKITTSNVWSQFFVISHNFSKKCRHFQSNVDNSSSSSSWSNSITVIRDCEIMSRASWNCHFRGYSIITASLDIFGYYDAEKPLLSI